MHTDTPLESFILAHPPYWIHTPLNSSFILPLPPPPALGTHTHTHLRTPLFLPPVLGTARGSLAFSRTCRSNIILLHISKSCSANTAHLTRLGKGSSSWGKNRTSDHSFRTGHVDHSFRTGQVDHSFRTGHVDHSFRTGHVEHSIG